VRATWHSNSADKSWIHILVSEKIIQPPWLVDLIGGCEQLDQPSGTGVFIKGLKYIKRHGAGLSWLWHVDPIEELATKTATQVGKGTYNEGPIIPSSKRRRISLHINGSGLLVHAAGYPVGALILHSVGGI